MLDSNGHNDSNEKGELVMGKVLEQSKEQTQRSEENISLLFQVYKFSGVHPVGYENLNQYLEAVVRAEDTESLKGFRKFTDSPWYGEIIEDELKKRGELS